MQSLFHLGDNLRLTVDPSFQYTLANGGGSTLIEEKRHRRTTPTARIVGNTGLTGWDLNGDGDLLDSVRFYTPNTTNTRRYGLTTSLIYDINDDNQLVRVAYSLDYAKHRQTAASGVRLDDNGDPAERVRRPRKAATVLTADGSELRGRDRYSVAELNQFAAEYRGEFLDDKLDRTSRRARAILHARAEPVLLHTERRHGSIRRCSLCTTQMPVRDAPERQRRVRQRGRLPFSTSAVRGRRSSSTTCCRTSA